MADEALLAVRVTPRARRDAIGPMADGVLPVRLAAPPVEGAANKALIALLAEALAVPRSAVRLESGARGRHKRVRISGIGNDEAARRLGQR
ncbi:MAG: DUF167 domain-containing protein [Sphingomonadaceae bacterium]|nr:DUF167 domain-containing protein [Sphingomonadaceae bacterium]